MATQSLAAMCAIAFITVFSVLTSLAIVMRLVTAIFPETERPGPGLPGPAAEPAPDPAVVAAITTTMTAVHPGTRVSGIEEVK